MIGAGVNGVVLRIRNGMGEIGDIRVLGKTLEQWAGSAFNAPYATLTASPVLDISEKLRSVIDAAKPVTVVLYCDTPLVNQKTIESAVAQLVDLRMPMLKLPRGCVYSTEFLQHAEGLFAQPPTADGEFEAAVDCESLNRVTQALRRRINNYHASKGVLIYDSKNTHIDCDAVIESGVEIEPYNFIKGKTIIKSGARILAGNRIENCIIGRDARVDSSRLYNSFVGDRSTVGPFAYIRPDTVIGCDCRIGDFVELKNCIIGDGSKVSHLTYIGDAELGAECNVGCGVVFANYDGKNKYRSIVGSRVFIGSNANVVAPVTIGDNSFIAAGSTVTKEVPATALAVARARQTNIPHWKGNMYAPCTDDTDTRDIGAFVQSEDGIIDVAATDNRGAAQAQAGDGANNNGYNGQ